jgi:H+/Cl- antiporter ClcA
MFKTRLNHRLDHWRDRLSGLDALPQLTVLGLLTGIAAGVVIVFFRYLVEIPLFFILPNNIENFEGLSKTTQFWLPFLGALSLGFVLQLVDKKYHATSVTHVLDRIHNHQARLPLGNFIHQLIGGAWCLVTGQSVGREGPAVHLGAGCGSLIGQWLRLPNNSLRPLVGCGVAAAIAACFNTPLAGVIFAMEVVVMEYSIIGFIPVILAAVAGSTINQIAFGSDTIFHTPSSAMGSLFELPFMVLTGLVVALFAAVFIHIQNFCCRLSLGRPIFLRFAIAGLIAACGATLAPQVMGVGYDTIDSLLTGNMGVGLLLGMLIIKLLVTGVSLGSGIPGGVIGPLLFMGACIGGATGILANQFMFGSASAIGFYVVLGMGAMMGAVLNAPLAAMMAILELTYNPHIIFPSMLVVIVACLTTRWAFHCDGLFQTLLKTQGKKGSFLAHEQMLSRTGVRSIMEQNIQLSSTTLTREIALSILAQHPKWIVLLDEKLLVNPSDVANYIKSKTDQADAFINLLTIPAQRLDLIELSEDTTLYQAITSMNEARVDAAYIPNSRRLGIITREQIDNFYKI